MVVFDGAFASEGNILLPSDMYHPHLPAEMTVMVEEAAAESRPPLLQ
jgi:hypothetical protein